MGSTVALDVGGWLTSRPGHFKPQEIDPAAIVKHIGNENCALLGCYSASSGNFLPTFRDNQSNFLGSVTLTLEDGTDRLSRNVGKKLPLLAE